MSTIEQGISQQEVTTESRSSLAGTVDRLLQLRGNEISLTSVLRTFNPDHVHWKAVGSFDPGKDLYDWLLTKCLGSFLRQKFVPDKSVSLNEASRRLYEQYFRAHGVEGKIDVYSYYALLDYRTGARIDPEPNGKPWPAENVVKLFPEVDFRIGVDHPALPDDERKRVVESIYLLANTSKVQGETYKPHILGYWGEDDKWMSIKSVGDRNEFLYKTDEWLGTQGVQDGINGLVIPNRDSLLVDMLLASRVRRVTP